MKRRFFSFQVTVVLCAACSGTDDRTPNAAMFTAAGANSVASGTSAGGTASGAGGVVNVPGGGGATLLTAGGVGGSNGLGVAGQTGNPAGGGMPGLNAGGMGNIAGTANTAGNINASGGMNTAGVNTGGVNTAGMNTGGMNVGGMNTGGTQNLGGVPNMAGSASVGGSGGSMDGLFAFPIPARTPTEQCGYCHGINGEGGMLAPEIQHPVREYATYVVRNGREHPDFDDDMPAYDETELPEELLNQIFDFLDSQPQPTTGEGLYQDYCQNCHGADAETGLADHAIVNESLMELIENVRDGHHAGEFDNRTGFMPVQSEAELSDAEIGLIADYLGTL